MQLPRVSWVMYTVKREIFSKQSRLKATARRYTAKATRRVAWRAALAVLFTALRRQATKWGQTNHSTLPSRLISSQWCLKLLRRLVVRASCLRLVATQLRSALFYNLICFMTWINNRKLIILKTTKGLLIDFLNYLLRYSLEILLENYFSTMFLTCVFKVDYKIWKIVIINLL